MQDRDAKLLFEYLGSILYESDPVPPAEDEISPGARELLGGLSCLSTYVKELTAYSHALATGDLDAPLPDSASKPKEMLSLFGGNRNVFQESLVS